MIIVPETRTSSETNIVVAGAETVTDSAEYGPDSVYYDLFEEATVPLDELFPDEFNRYLELFYKYNIKTGYHDKRRYDGGWIQRKKDYKDGSGQYKAFCHEGLIARHLDSERAARLDERIRSPHDFWIGLYPGQKSSFRIYDVDHKHNVGGYFTDYLGRKRPIPNIALIDFVNLKRLYDRLQDRPVVWCISSATLGLHTWEKLAYPQTIELIQKDGKQIVKGIPLKDSCPVHPFNRVLRRPFGQDYFTITPAGRLSDWVRQLQFFDNPEPVSFEQIAAVLCRLLSEAWGDYGSARDGADLGVKQPNINTAELNRSLEQVQTWLAEGCPVQEEEFPTSLSPMGDEPSTSSTRTKTPSCDIKLDEVFNGQWVQSCVGWARDGLSCDDSLSHVVHCLARWLYFIELFHLPSDDRIERTIGLLQQFCLTKHNGFITRLKQGLSDEVTAQVTRVVEGAVSSATEKDLFARIRQKRRNGAYRQTYFVEPLILGEQPIGQEKMKASPSTVLLLISRNTLEPDHTEIPQVVEAIERYYRRHGKRLYSTTKKKLIAFVNFLGSQDGQANLNQKDLLPELGFKSGEQRKHLKHLEKAGIIFIGDAYSTGRFGKMYRLSSKVKKLYDKQKVVEAQKMVG